MLAIVCFNACWVSPRDLGKPQLHALCWQLFVLNACWVSPRHLGKPQLHAMLIMRTPSESCRIHTCCWLQSRCFCCIPYCSLHLVLLLMVLLLLLLLLLLVFPVLNTANNWHVLAAAALGFNPCIVIAAAAAQLWFAGMLCCCC